VSRNTRRISWIKAARKELEGFPADAQLEILRALTVAAEGRKADIAKPMKGLDRQLRNRLAFAHRRLAGGLCGEPRGGHLGHPCLPEEIPEWHQEAAARDRFDPGSPQAVEGTAVTSDFTRNGNRSKES
jgi:hypothetical protein